MSNFAVVKCFILTSLISVIFSLVDGNDQCSKLVPVTDDSSKYYRAFKHLDNIGKEQCLKQCKQYKRCEKVHHNREQLTCDLMLTSATPGNVTSLLNVTSPQIDNTGCFICTENEVCVILNDGSHSCVREKGCPSSKWVTFKDKCYFFTILSIKVDANRAFCTKHGATMARVEEESVRVFLRSEMIERGIDKLWIGAYKTAYGDWVWGPEDTVVNADWGDKEPSSLSGKEYVYMMSKWHDAGRKELANAACVISYYISP